MLVCYHFSYLELMTRVTQLALSSGQLFSYKYVGSGPHMTLLITEPGFGQREEISLSPPDAFLALFRREEM
ncbi:hypothetical protein HanIR_Chr02g0086571 [Helianthus annuus]|nr:hypothetical protein HanIR_Chr02g0086571 [Helianthus annuus]